MQSGVAQPCLFAEGMLRHITYKYNIYRSIQFIVPFRVPVLVEVGQD